MGAGCARWMFIALKLYTLACFENASCSNILSASCLHFTGKKALLFDTVHPFVQEAKNSQNLNRYTYVLNNPMGYTDPSGYFFVSLLKGTINKLDKALGGHLSTFINVGFAMILIFIININ